MELIDHYYDELVEWSAIISNFCQLTKDTQNENFQFGEETNLEPYNKNTSLLYTAETDEFAEFVDGKPAFLVKYHLILSLGSSKILDDPIGYTRDNLKNNIFYLDYFWVNPLKINEIECIEKSCQIEDKLSYFSWCTNCNGTYHLANNLIHLMHPKIHFTKLPRNSIIYIGKTITEIDDSVEMAIKVKKFLELDRQKLNILQERIDAAEEKIKKFMVMIDREKNHCNQKINELLSIRGGSMEAYLQIIDEYNQKVNE